ncbi:hypothetical protein [Streptomyces physcomitrii]|uniref:hypothetical protein n=1 Tax=Streptomyces physcomitrii TaxID=2724184 RepID=UPI003F4D3D37
MEERNGGSGSFVGQRFGVGEPTKSVDGGVEIEVTAARTSVLATLDSLGVRASASVDSPAVTVRDPADLLHIDVNHAPGATGGDLPWIPVCVAAGVNEPAPVQSESE